MADNIDNYSRRRHHLQNHQILTAPVKTRPVSELPRFKVLLKPAGNPNSPLKSLPSNTNQKSSSESKHNGSLSSSPTPNGARRSSRRSSRNSGPEFDHDDDEDEEEEEDLDADDDLREKPFKKRKLLEEVSAADSGFPHLASSVPRNMNKKRHNSNDVLSPPISSDKNNNNNKANCLHLQSINQLGKSLPSKLLEGVLDKLQKKDTFSVFAEPVDANEVPGYYDYIKKPMDFGTMRKKIRNGAYRSVDTFQDDIYLICSNAMSYNAKDTIYYKQARTIQDAARKILEGLKAALADEGDFRVQQSQGKKMINRRLPTASDCTSGASLATSWKNGDSGKYQKTVQRDRVGVNSAANSDGQLHSGWNSRMSNVISSSPGDVRFDNQDTASVLKLTRRTQLYDDNRRSTYQQSHTSMSGLGPALMALGSETQHLIPMAHQQLDFAYARSLARFSGDLGPAVWKIAAERIRKALPPGVPFGPGWVLEVPSSLSSPSKGQITTQPKTKSSSSLETLDKNTVHHQPNTLKSERDSRASTCSSIPDSIRPEPMEPISISSSTSAAGSVDNACQSISKSSPQSNTLAKEVRTGSPAVGAAGPDIEKEIPSATSPELVSQDCKSTPPCPRLTEGIGGLQYSELNRGIEPQDGEHTLTSHIANTDASPVNEVPQSNNIENPRTLSQLEKPEHCAVQVKVGLEELELNKVANGTSPQRLQRELHADVQQQSNADSGSCREAMSTPLGLSSGSVNLLGPQQSNANISCDRKAMNCSKVLSPSLSVNDSLGFTNETHPFLSKKILLVADSSSSPPDLNVSLHSPVSTIASAIGNVTDDQQPDLALQL